ncbi:ComEA family DNA-binding protein [Psychrobacter urativorans]|uniref:Competence protein ComEA n=1 Tax=Psychrobacter urativorans TaxID=45610 RepID=A0A0M5MK85_9GAMM|nr:ComEA family DNA-binding protein [Psychrobacter urativorans]ALF59818.1 competence protein ComEA [Psychrobacter urativorans]
MNARSRSSCAYASIQKRIYVTFLFIVVFTSALNHAQAEPCFDNPKSAYQYLLQQEKLTYQANTQMGININRATESELVSLHGIGSSKAQAIILYREMFGDFKTVDDLQKVKGIGPKTIEKNRARLQIRN